MRPHAIVDGRRFWTYDKALADRVSALHEGTYVDRYSLGQQGVSSGNMPFAVYTKGDGAMLLNWDDYRQETTAMTYEQIKLNLADMAAMPASFTPKAALERIEHLERVLHKVAYWLDTDQEILDNMTATERDDHIRMHKLALAALF